MATLLACALALAAGGLALVLALPWPARSLDFRAVERLLRGEWVGHAPRPAGRTERLLTRLGLHPDPDSRLARDLALAGWRISLRHLCLLKLGGLAAGLAMAVAAWAAGDPVLAVPLVLAGAAAWRMPDARAAGQARRYRQDVIRRLPAFLQTLAILTEAGMHLLPAIRAFVGQDRGPLGRQLRRALDDTELGVPLAGALLRMAGGCQVQDLHRCVVVLVQAAERGGPGLPAACRELAAEAWLKRRDAVRQASQEAAARMLAPLVFLVMPTLFLFLIGPAVYSLFQSF